MTKAQENLKSDIEKINDEATIEKVKIFIMGILASKDYRTLEAIKMRKKYLLKIVFFFYLPRKWFYSFLSDTCKPA